MFYPSRASPKGVENLHPKWSHEWSGVILTSSGGVFVSLKKQTHAKLGIRGFKYLFIFIPTWWNDLTDIFQMGGSTPLHPENWMIFRQLPRWKRWEVVYQKETLGLKLKICKPIKQYLPVSRSYPRVSKMRSSAWIFSFFPAGRFWSDTKAKPSTWVFCWCKTFRLIQ